MSQVKFFVNMNKPVPTNNAAEGLYFNQWGIGLSDGTITTDVSSVIKFNPDKDRFYRYTSTKGEKALFSKNGHNVHVQHDDYEGILGPGPSHCVLYFLSIHNHYPLLAPVE